MTFVLATSTNFVCQHLIFEESQKLRISMFIVQEVTGFVHLSKCRYSCNLTLAKNNNLMRMFYPRFWWIALLIYPYGIRAYAMLTGRLYVISGYTGAAWRSYSKRDDALVCPASCTELPSSPAPATVIAAQCHHTAAASKSAECAIRCENDD